MSGRDGAPGQRKDPGTNLKRKQPGAGHLRTRGNIRPAGNPRWPSTDPDNRNAGWLIISYLVAGMLIYGGLGWLIGHWIGTVAVASLIGILIGLALALVLVVLRYGRS